MQGNNQQAPQIVHVHIHQKRQGHGLLWFILFGWWYVAWLALKHTTILAWRLLVAYPWKWTIAASRATVRASKAFHARYGWRGWGIVAGVVVVLAIIAKITGQ